MEISVVRVRPKPEYLVGTEVTVEGRVGTIERVEELYAIVRYPDGKAQKVPYRIEGKQ